MSTEDHAQCGAVEDGSFQAIASRVGATSCGLAVPLLATTKDIVTTTVHIGEVRNVQLHHDRFEDRLRGYQAMAWRGVQLGYDVQRVRSDR